jgi:hypothetical protein
MAKFNPFDFLKKRKVCIPPSQEEQENFDLFMTQMALSMAKGVGNILNATNRNSFFKLPKKYQCLAFTSLDGYNLLGPWQKTKKESKKSTKDLMEKACKVFKNCSENQIKAYLDYKLLDEDKINELYQKLYDPGSIKIKKSKT